MGFIDLIETHCFDYRNHECNLDGLFHTYCCDNIQCQARILPQGSFKYYIGNQDFDLLGSNTPK